MSDKMLKEILSEMQDMKSKMESGFNALRTKVDNVETKIDGITKQVVTNSENITDIKENQKIIANVVNQMAAVQERQEQTINLLARRSLDQEAELKRIK